MHNILEDIIKKKKLDLAKKKKDLETTIVASHSNPYGRFIDAVSSKDIAIIGEIKLASPTEVLLGIKNEIIPRAIAYEKAGIDAISFITEKHYFNSDISFISKIRENVSLPILQKDFVIDEQQIYEARQIGSDALLLIARLVDTETLKKFSLLCQRISIEPIIEINNDEDLEKAMEANTKIIAVNARDLETFEIDIYRACKLLKKIPDTFIKLGFSGVKSRNEVRKYKAAGAKGILIGTELMKTKNIQDFICNVKNI